MLAAQAAASAALFLGEAMDISKISQVEGVLRRQTENLILIGMPGSGKTTPGPAAGGGHRPTGLGQ